MTFASPTDRDVPSEEVKHFLEILEYALINFLCGMHRQSPETVHVVFRGLRKDWEYAEATLWHDEVVSYKMT